MTKTKIKTIETVSLTIHVIQRDIEEGKCGLISKCMHKIAIERELRRRDARGGDHRVRVDGSIVRFNLHGHRFEAILPKMPKKNLLQFDKERKARERAEKKGETFASKVHPHKYRIEATKGRAIVPLTRERQDQINAARRRRIESGKPDKPKYDLRYRVEGLGAV
jgi:hypothetical protein